jgi:cytochrome c peroxidase
MCRMRRCISAFSAILACVCIGGTAAQNPSNDRIGDSSRYQSLGLPYPVFPVDNPGVSASVNLGRRLFFDKRLSRDNSISCATCHDPQDGFSDPHAVSIGTSGRAGERHSMTLLNIAFVQKLMWDGRAESLEQQALLPFQSRSELDVPIDRVIVRLKRVGYSGQFMNAYGTDITAESITKALAAYERSLVAGGSPFDEFIFEGNELAISKSAQRGFEIFLRAKCDSCHLIMTPGLHPFAMHNVLFTDGKFHNLGVGMDQEHPDRGREDVTGDPHDWGAFRTPSLRNVAIRGPYFHDGSAATLSDVVEFYDRGGKLNRNQDPALHPLGLSKSDKVDLVEFLESLTSSHVHDYNSEELKADATRLATSNE